MAKIPIAELKQLLDRQRACFDGFQQGNQRVQKGDLEHFAVMTHVTVCCLLMKLIDGYSSSPEDLSVHPCADISPSDPVRKSVLKIVSDDDPPAA